jgi:ABC-2 type transport system ATP-binding protein
MLRFENLTKRYGDQTVFAGLSQRFGPGCVALQADNGAGKSTLIEILAGVTPPDQGEVWIAGHNLRSERLMALAALAYVPGECLDYPSLTGRALLESVAAQRETALDGATLELAKRFGLSGHFDHGFEQMSLGTRKKMYLTAASIGTSAVIVADEPSNGLDHAAWRVLVELFTTLGRDRVVLFATHDPRFAAACAARSIDFSDLHAPIRAATY